MNVHKHARLTPVGRGLAVRRMEAGEGAVAVAAGLGVSVRTLYKWRRRWRTEGEQGLQDRTSRPRHMPARTTRARERHVVRLRRKGWTNQAIAECLSLALSTVSAINRRHGLGGCRR